MKLRNLLLLLFLLFFWNQTAKAQKPVRTYLRLQGEYFLDSVPSVEASETIGIHLMIDNTVISEFNHIPLPAGTPTKQPLLPEQLDEFPWRIENWKIIEGGGTLAPDSQDGTKRLYTAPAQAPPNNLITVSVDLIPKHTGDPKIVLIQTIYFTDNETAIYLNMPQIGANFSKYVTKKNAGMKVPTMQGIDPRVAARMSPDIRAKMAQAQAAVTAAQTESGINLSAVTSNAMAFYDPKNNLTAVKITTLALQYNNRRASAPTAGSSMLEFSFRGKGVGTYSLDEPAAGAGFLLSITPPAGVGCGKNNGSSDAPCSGTVTITDMDDKVIKGMISIKVHTASPDGKSLYHGTLFGKFTVNRAN